MQLIWKDKLEFLTLINSNILRSGLGGFRSHTLLDDVLAGFEGGNDIVFLVVGVQSALELV